MWVKRSFLGCCIQAHTWQEPNVLLSTARSRPKQATHYQLSEGVRHANKHANTQGPKITKTFQVQHLSAHRSTWFTVQLPDTKDLRLRVQPAGAHLRLMLKMLGMYQGPRKA